MLVSQYLAYLDGRIDEVALDRYAQADDGSVWYLGEDVFDYRDGTVAITEGSWLAGRSGPPAMIMPADPQVGDHFRSENVTGVVYEELEVTDIDQTFDGPRGPVEGAVVMEELGLDEETSNKVFAPGYGEFDTSNGHEVEAMALAVPTDAIDEVVPTDLRLLSTTAFGVLENARLDDWEAAEPTVELMASLWEDLQANGYPPRVVDTLTAALDDLAAAVRRERAPATAQAAVDVAQSALDLELLYRGDVEADRVHLHAQQLRVHAANDDRAGVNAEVATLEWIRDRLTASISEERLAALDAGLTDLRTAAGAGSLGTAADIAARLAAGLRG